MNLDNYIKTILSGVKTWAQSTFAKKSDIKDLYYSETKNKTLVDNLTSEDYNNGDVPECNFKAGESYDVIWNGTLYEGLVCFYDGSYNVIGTQDQGYPFYIDDDGGDGLYISSDDEEDFTVSIIGKVETIHQIDDKYIADNISRTSDIDGLRSSVAETYETKEDATAKYNELLANTSGGNNVVGKNVTGTEYYIDGSRVTAGTYAEVFNDYTGNKASGDYSHAEGRYTTASGEASHAEGMITIASGKYSHSEGNYTIASGNYSHAEGEHTTASGRTGHAEGNYTIASGFFSHAEGNYTIASGVNQHAQGRFNVEDTSNTYAHIVGNGTSDTVRSNAHTLDWSGNAWYAGTIESTGVILKSSTDGSTKRFKITVDDNGTLTAMEITSN